MANLLKSATGSFLPTFVQFGNFPASSGVLRVEFVPFGNFQASSVPLEAAVSKRET